MPDRRRLILERILPLIRLRRRGRGGVLRRLTYGSREQCQAYDIDPLGGGGDVDFDARLRSDESHGSRLIHPHHMAACRICLR